MQKDLAWGKASTMSNVLTLFGRSLFGWELFFFSSFFFVSFFFSGKPQVNILNLRLNVKPGNFTTLGMGLQNSAFCSPPKMHAKPRND